MKSGGSKNKRRLNKSKGTTSSKKSRGMSDSNIKEYKLNLDNYNVRAAGKQGKHAKSTSRIVKIADNALSKSSLDAKKLKQAKKSKRGSLSNFKRSNPILDLKVRLDDEEQQSPKVDYFGTRPRNSPGRLSPRSPGRLS